MIRMIEESDIFACSWWYNWYVTHSNATFETVPVQAKQFTDRVHQIREKYPWIILEDDGVPRGYAYLSSFHTKDAYLWTCDLTIYLAPDQLHLGYGSQLMKAIIDLAVKDGYYNMVSIITEGNEASIRLHEKFGFERVGTIPHAGYKNGEWHGVHYYVKTLQKFEGGQMPEAPKNLDPYRTVKPGRVPLF